MSQALKTPNEQAIVGPHVRHSNPHPQYALASDTITQDELDAAVAAAVVEVGGSVVAGTNISTTANDGDTVVSVTGGATGVSLLNTETPRQARQTVEIEPVGAAFTYNGSGQLTSVADGYGTKAFTYNGSGQLISIAGTGKYRNKTFSYTGDQLTGIAVA